MSYGQGAVLLHLSHEGDPHGDSFVDSAGVLRAGRVQTVDRTDGVEELRRPNEEVQRGFGSIVTGFDDDELRPSRQVLTGPESYILFPGRDEHDDGRIFQVIGSEYETAVAVVTIVADAPGGQTGLHDLAFQVLCYRTAPAAVKEDVVLHPGEVGWSQRGIVIQAEG